MPGIHIDFAKVAGGIDGEADVSWYENPLHFTLDRIWIYGDEDLVELHPQSFVFGVIDRLLHEEKRELIIGEIGEAMQ
jgi:hypothetical protein